MNLSLEEVNRDVEKNRRKEALAKAEADLAELIRSRRIWPIEMVGKKIDHVEIQGSTVLVVTKGGRFYSVQYDRDEHIMGTGYPAVETLVKHGVIEASELQQVLDARAAVCEVEKDEMIERHVQQLVRQVGVDRLQELLDRQRK